MKRQRHALVILLPFFLFTANDEAKAGPFQIFSGRYVAQPLTPERLRWPHRGTQKRKKAPPSDVFQQSNFRQADFCAAASAGRAAGQGSVEPRATKILIYRMELLSLVNQAWLQVRLRRMPVTSKSSVFRLEPR